MANLVVHFEIHATEPQRLVDFYSELLGWTFTRYGDDYWVIETGEGSIGNAAGQPGMGINGGLARREGPAPEVGAPVNGCNIVVGVQDVDGLMQRGVELGGTEALPATDWPGIGRGGYLVDPDGRLVGQHDGFAAADRRPPSTWRPGEHVDDRHGVSLPPGVGGPLEVRVGLYSASTGQRLRLPTGADYVSLGLVRPG